MAALHISGFCDGSDYVTWQLCLWGPSHTTLKCHLKLSLTAKCNIAHLFTLEERSTFRGLLLNFCYCSTNFFGFVLMHSGNWEYTRVEGLDQTVNSVMKRNILSEKFGLHLLDYVYSFSLLKWRADSFPDHAVIANAHAVAIRPVAQIMDC